MKKSTVIVICYLFTLRCVTTLGYKTIDSRLLNRSVNRTFYTINQLLYIDYEILMEYHGNSSATGFIFSVESMIAKNVVHVEAMQLDSLMEPKLRIQETNVENLTGIYWFINFKYPLQNRKSIRVKTSVVLARCLRPLPAYINQEEESQLVLLHASHYFYSAYCTDQQITVVKLPSPNVERYSIIKPAKKYANTISYGPYRGISPFNISDMWIHFEYNAALLTVRSLKRVIKISSWGNIAIAERIRLQNTGAALKGPFSRYVYMKHYRKKRTSANKIIPILPKSAKNIYYLDDLGNISTSHVVYAEDSVKLTLKFRYPLLGGWNISLITGYDVPASEYVFHIEDDYVLHMPIINNLYEGMFIETMETVVIIPEGAVGGELVTPFPVDTKYNSKYYMLLDTIGRTAVGFHVNNLVDKHIQCFQVHYQLPKSVFIYKPVMLICLVFILLVLLWIIKNYKIVLDFGLLNYCNGIPERNTISEVNRCKSENEIK